jgi:putative PIN family toxin of toxin-antitoxin system
MGEIREIKVVADTNIVVSGLLFGGTPGKLISLWKKKRIIPFTCKEMTDELLRVLAYPKFRLSEQEIEYMFYQEVMPYVEKVEIVHGEVIVQNDPSDDIFIRCAMAAEVKIVISGDRHLLSLKSYKGIKIVPVSQFLKSLKELPENNRSNTS